MKLKHFVLFIAFLFSNAVLHAQGVGDTTQYVKVELYFGLTENGSIIPEKTWQRFMDDYITPKFPGGMTIVDAKGQWRNKAGKIAKEKSKVVILICKKNNHTDSSISTIKSKYCELHHQESVLEVDSRTEKVSF